MSVESYRSALADCLNGIAGLRCPTPYMTDQINPPQAMIDLDQVNYDYVFDRGADSYEFTVLLFDQRTSERASQRRLDNWRDGTSTTSLKYVVENDPDVAAECQFTRVVSAAQPVSVTVATVDYLLVEFSLEVVF